MVRTDKQTNGQTSSSSDRDDSIVVVGKKPAAHPEGKTPFPCVLGEVLQIMHDRLNSNASKNNVDSLLLDTLKTILSNLVKDAGII